MKSAFGLEMCFDLGALTCLGFDLMRVNLWKCRIILVGLHWYCLCWPENGDFPALDGPEMKIIARLWLTRACASRAKALLCSACNAQAPYRGGADLRRRSFPRRRSRGDRRSLLRTRAGDHARKPRKSGHRAKACVPNNAILNKNRCVC